MPETGTVCVQAGEAPGVLKMSVEAVWQLGGAAQWQSHSPGLQRGARPPLFRLREFTPYLASQQLGSVAKSGLSLLQVLLQTGLVTSAIASSGLLP